jgi:hypothetical protein
LAESAITGGYGFVVDIKDPAPFHKWLWAEGGGRVVVSCAPSEWGYVAEEAQALGITAVLLGEVTGSSMDYLYHGEEMMTVSLRYAEKAWKEAIPCHMK